MVWVSMAIVPFLSAQTSDRDLRYDVFRAFGAGSEIGVSVRANRQTMKSRTTPAPSRNDPYMNI
jgi:hypothetical protein